MRLALLSWESKHSISVGGMGEHVSELAAAMARRGHQTHVFTRVGQDQDRYDLVDGVHYHRCPFELHEDFLLENQRMCDSFAWHLAETEAFLGGAFDVVHGHDWLAVSALDQIKERLRRPVVMTIHSTEFGRCGNQLFGGPSERIREREWYGTYIARRVICVSESFRREVQQLYNVPVDKMNVIYNGVDPSRFDSAANTRSVRKRYAIDRGDRMVLFAGRLTRQKGPDVLLEAVPSVLARHPATKVVFAGDGHLRSGLQERAQRLGLEPHTRFVGHQTGAELVSLFKSADVVCVPSRNEPFGIVILEAWSARKPVVATRNGGPAEFVRHQTNGLSVADDCGSISGGINTVLSDRPAARRMGYAGRREVEAHFCWDRIAAQTEEVYESVCSGPQGGQGGWHPATQESVFMARKANVLHDDAVRPVMAERTDVPPVAFAGESPARGPAAATAPRMVRGRTGTAPSRSDGLHREPTHEQIRDRAYQIFLRRGGRPGAALEDWLQAERELRGG